VLFGIGLLGATLLAGAVLPLATAYAVSEAFGMPKGVNLDFRRGKIFFSLFTTLIVVGVVLALIPNIPVMKLLVGVQVLNGALLPIILIFILLLINDKHLTKELRNTKLNNVLAIGTLILITTAIVVMLGGQLWTWLGT
jgi:Mn2+/Fe2+ NRAMP family transporter